MNVGDFFGPATPIAEADIRRAAQRIGCDPAVIEAVVLVESGGSGFLPDGRPKILFEAHLFGRLTKHAYAGTLDPKGRALSARSWDRSLYGAGGTWQYTRLVAAMALNEDAALRATSFGAFQIIGDNCEECGFATVQDFVQAHISGGGAQLDAFISFVMYRKLDDELRDKRWADFARQYNGPAFRQNQYDTKMASAFAKAIGRWTVKVKAANRPGEHQANSVSRAQVARVQATVNLYQLTDPPLVTDGWVGEKTAHGVKRLQEMLGMVPTGHITPELIDRLAAD